MRNIVQTILLLLLVICWPTLLVLVQCQSKLITCDRIKEDCKFICKNVPGYSDDVEIDLSLVNDPSGGPKFKGIDDSQGSSTYDWNPCTKFSSGSCRDVYACQHADSKQYSLGSILIVYYSTNKKQFIMHYLLGDSGRELDVTLLYEEGEEGRVSDVTKDAQYTMKLYTEYAPHHGGSSNDDSGGGISIGTVLCIIFFTVLVLYLGIGIAYKYGQGALGKDRIPNYGFWAKIPGLIKDGCIFSAKKSKDCVSHAKERTGKSRQQRHAGEYEEIKEES